MPSARLEIRAGESHLGIYVNYEEEIMSLGTILLIVLILMLIGVIPTWPHSRSWGYWPSGALGVIVLIIIILLVTGRL